MVQYRRNRVEGATYFFTVTLADRRSQALIEHIAELRACFKLVSSRRPFETIAVVVLPDHLHAVWTLPEGDADYSGRWRAIKAGFTRRLKLKGVALAKHRNGEDGLWQRRFWEHTIRDGDDLQQHVDYIHFNPVKHGHVAAVVDWPHSSFHRYVRRGMLPTDWAGTVGEDTITSFGE